MSKDVASCQKVNSTYDPLKIVYPKINFIKFSFNFSSALHVSKTQKTIIGRCVEHWPQRVVNLGCFFQKSSQTMQRRCEYKRTHNHRDRNWQNWPLVIGWVLHFYCLLWAFLNDKTLMISLLHVAVKINENSKCSWRKIFQNSHRWVNYSALLKNLHITDWTSSQLLIHHHPWHAFFVDHTR